MRLALIILLSFICTSLLAAEQEMYWRYSVRPGDNLITLGKTHLINPDDWKEVQRLNHVANPFRMPVGSILNIPLVLLKQGPASAEVISVAGQAQLKQSAGEYQPLNVGQKLGPGAQLVTKENSKVTIKFADGSLTSMASNTLLVLDTMSIYSGGAMVDTKLRLQQGQVEAHANPNHVLGNKMQISTPTAIAAVRGTQFRVTADDKSINQETLEGKVDLGSAGEVVAVDKGYGSFAEAGKVPIPPVVLLPAVDTASLKSQYDHLPVSFDMPKLEGAIAWLGVISVDAGLNKVVAEAENIGSTLVFKDLPDGQYFLSARAKDKQGIAGYDALHPFRLKARPFSPELIYPTRGGVVRDEHTELQWKAVSEAKLYEVEIARDADFKQIDEVQHVEATSYRVATQLQVGQYFWRVASIAKDAAGRDDQGPYINTSEFTYKPLPAKPDISQLQVQVAQNRVYVTTTPPLEGLTYQVRLDNDANQQKNVWVGTGLQGEFNFLLKEFGKQTLYIRHVDSDGATSPAAVYEFDATPQ
jgi:hypothetical protein